MAASASTTRLTLTITATPIGPHALPIPDDILKSPNFRRFQIYSANKGTQYATNKDWLLAFQEWREFQGYNPHRLPKPATTPSPTTLGTFVFPTKR